MVVGGAHMLPNTEVMQQVGVLSHGRGGSTHAAQHRIHAAGRYDESWSWGS